MSNAQDTIARTIADNDVVLFMKGTADQPQCGFSNQVVRILDHLGVTYCDVNVLADPDIRDGVKVFSNWPTIPQLYIKGEFVGGCDIVREMFQTGELKALLAEKGLLETA
jgi:monothiol glutaredoxin